MLVGIGVLVGAGVSGGRRSSSRRCSTASSRAIGCRDRSSARARRCCATVGALAGWVSDRRTDELSPLAGTRRARRRQLESEFSAKGAIFASPSRASLRRAGPALRSARRGRIVTFVAVLPRARHRRGNTAIFSSSNSLLRRELPVVRTAPAGAARATKGGYPGGYPVWGDSARPELCSRRPWSPPRAPTSSSTASRRKRTVCSRAARSSTRSA